MTYVTPVEWSPTRLRHASYGTDDTYRLAATWVRNCTLVADWGGSTGYLRQFLRPGTRYLGVDGTHQDAFDAQVIADLSMYHQPAEAIVLRHVVDMTEDWRAVLRNALAAFRRRMVVVTFTPDADVTHMVKRKSGWPLWNFNPADLRALMQPFLVGEEFRQTSHPERLYYLEKPCAS